MMAVRRRVSQALHVLVAILTVAAFWWLVIRAASPAAGPAAGEQGACTKHTVVGFLKTHKCASSSVQNIFMRFGLKNELNFALPMSGNYVGRYMRYQRGMLGGTSWEAAGLPYSLFCLHTIWDRRQVASTLQPGAKYVTIVRDPVDLFESLWSYSSMSAYYHMDLEAFALAPKTGHLATRAYRNLGRNQMLWDAGLPANAMDNVTAVRAKIDEMEDTFGLVMMAERFDESMVLLRDFLCWDFGDVVNFKLNARKEGKKQELSSRARAALREYLAADYMVYDHFKARFEARVDTFGLARMSQELSALRRANARMSGVCSVEATDNDALAPGENKLWGRGVVAYTYNSSGHPDCRLFGLSELNFIDELRQVQRKRALRVLGEEEDFGEEEDEEEEGVASDEEDEGDESEEEEEETEEGARAWSAEGWKSASAALVPGVGVAMPSRLGGLPDIEKMKQMYAYRVS